MRTMKVSTTMLLAVLAGAAVGAGGYTFHYARGTAYLSDDPNACANCHVMLPHLDSWQKASHHDVASCNDCHVPHALIPKYLAKMENGYHHSKAFTLQDFPDRIRIRPSNRAVLQENCVRCHEPMVSEIVPHAGVEDMDCVRCHGDVGHGPVR